MVDVILLGWAVYLFLNGWNKGILCTLINPLSLALGILSSILYFQKTHNMIGLLIGLLAAPLGFAIILSVLFSTWHEKVTKSLPPEPLSRLVGAVVNTFWGTTMFVLAMLTIPALSPHIVQLDSIKQKILASYSYPFLKTYFEPKIPLLSGLEALSFLAKDEKKLEELQSQPEFSSVHNDDKIKDIAADKELMEQIQQKDFFKVLSNKKIQDALQDEKLIEKIMGLKKFLLDNPSVSSQPKVYEIK